MLDPIRAVMLATIVAYITGVAVDTLTPQYSDSVLEIGACAFIGSLTVLMLAGLRKSY